MSAHKKTSQRDELEALKAKFRDLLEGETDRGLALAGHAYLDDAINEFLRAYLLDVPEIIDKLMQPNGPLGSFGTRCDFAYTLGLVGSDMYFDLNQIRKIRNEFAHRYRPLGFSSSPVSDRCKNLKTPDLDDPKKKMESRDRFIMSVSLLASHFLSQMKKTSHREPGRDYRVQIDDFPGSFLVGEKQPQTAETEKMNPLTKKLQGVFYGVAISEDWPDERKLHQHHHFTRPPSYLVKLALMVHFGQRLPRGEEKSDWAIPLDFGGINWLVSDWKRYAWDIYGPEPENALAEKLQKKLESAAVIVGKQVAEEAKDYRDSDEISLDNNFPQLMILYEFFRNEVEETLDRLLHQPPAIEKPVPTETDLDNKVNLREFTAKLNTWFADHNALERKLHANTLAAILFFFSATEAILDAAFAVGDRQGLTFAEYRSLKWADRIKRWFNAGQGESAEVYQELIEIRREYRNTAAHSSPMFFFSPPIPGFGLVPVDYEELDLPRAVPWALREPDEAKRVFDTFDATLRHFQSHDLLKFALKYADSGIGIHISKKLSEDLKSHMTSLEAFEEELMRRCELQDRYDNMDI